MSLSFTHKQADRGFLARILRLGLKISGVHNGDLRVDTSVSVPAQSVVIGAIIAPRVEVRGLVRGDIFAREIIVHAGGQVWGDIYTRACQVFLGGHVRGRLNTLDEADFSLADMPAMFLESGDGDGEMPASPSPPTAIPEAPSPQLILIHRLENEAATALAGRAELEQAFEQKLAQKAGDAVAEVFTLRHELQATRADLQTTHQSLQETRLDLAARESELAAETGLRTQLEADLSRSQAEHAAAAQALNDQQEATDLLRQQKAVLESDWRQTLEELRQMTERAHNLESAMQASLLHSAEQEEALLRWQELAEVTESQAAELQHALQAAQLELEKQTTLAATLREERAELRRQLTQTRAERDALAQAEEAQAAAEAALAELQQLYARAQGERERLRLERDEMQGQLALQEETFATLTDLRASQKDVTQRYEALRAQRDDLETQLETRQAELAQLRTRLQEAEAAREELVAAAARAADLQAALARQEDLEAALATATTQANESVDLLVWYKASLQVTQQDLAEREQSLARSQAKNAGLLAQLEERARLVDKWKTNVSRLTELLYAAERRAKKLEAGLAQYTEAAQLESDRLAAELRQSQAQRNASEQEANVLHQSVAAQGERLAWLQTTLVERDLALEKLQATFDEQKRSLYSVRQLATARIRELEQELALAQRQLKDLTQWLERKKTANKQQPTSNN